MTTTSKEQQSELSQCIWQQDMLRAGVDLLTAVAEEVETQLGSKPRQAAAAVLAAQADEVLATLGVALSQALAAAGELPASHAAMSHAHACTHVVPCCCWRACCMQSNEGGAQ